MHRGVHKTTLSAFLAVSVLILVSCKATPKPAMGGHHGDLVAQVRDSLRVRNPRIETVQVLSIQALPWSTARLALLARGAGSDHFEGRFEDELFTVFVVDSTLTHVIRMVDTIPTRRWHDYEVRFERVGRDSLYLVGAGATYGDEAIRRSYDWDSLSR